LELVREARAAGRTVFFSSHILSEVQAVCDRVGIIRAGELVQTERVETLTHQQFKRLRLTLRQAPPAGAFALEGVTETARDGQTVQLEIRQGLEQVLAAALPYGLDDLETIPVTLEEIFLAYYDRPGNGGAHA
jgi:ABC-2 type transport system ATP-binding protein